MDTEVTVLKSQYATEDLNCHQLQDRLDGATEFGPRGMLAYAFSYFCVKELIDRFGKKLFLQFAASLASCDNISLRFHEAFGISIAQFNDEMKRSLCH